LLLYIIINAQVETKEHRKR